MRNPETRLEASAEFEAFMHAYQDMVFSTAARLTGNDAHAEDIAQEVFIRAFEHFEELRTSPTAGGWLKTVATRLSLNHLTRYRRRWRFFSELPRDDADEDPPEADFPVPDNNPGELEADQRSAIIEQALMKLPDHQRVPLVLFHFQDMSYVDIARELNVSLPKLKTDIMRGRAALAKVLARAGLEEA